MSRQKNIECNYIQNMLFSCIFEAIANDYQKNTYVVLQYPFKELSISKESFRGCWNFPFIEQNLNNMNVKIVCTKNIYTPAQIQFFPKDKIVNVNIPSSF
jgi:hypothetical protein